MTDVALPPRFCVFFYQSDFAPENRYSLKLAQSPAEAGFGAFRKKIEKRL